MSSDQQSLTAAELLRLADTLEQANVRTMTAMLQLSQQSAAGTLLDALVIRELGRAGLIDVEALRAEAITRAEPLGDGVVAVVKSVFGGEPPVMPEAPNRSQLRVIRGGLQDPE